MVRYEKKAGYARLGGSRAKLDGRPAVDNFDRLPQAVRSCDQRVQRRLGATLESRLGGKIFTASEFSSAAWAIKVLAKPVTTPILGRKHRIEGITSGGGKQALSLDACKAT